MKAKKKIKELKHEVNFWKNSNGVNYQRWKEANYIAIEQAKVIVELLEKEKGPGKNQPLL